MVRVRPESILRGLLRSWDLYCYQYNPDVQCRHQLYQFHVRSAYDRYLTTQCDPSRDTRQLSLTILGDAGPEMSVVTSGAGHSLFRLPWVLLVFVPEGRIDGSLAVYC